MNLFIALLPHIEQSALYGGRPGFGEVSATIESAGDQRVFTSMSWSVADQVLDDPLSRASCRCRHNSYRRAVANGHIAETRNPAGHFRT